jgi:hypothetical protein
MEMGAAREVHHLVPHHQWTVELSQPRTLFLVFARYSSAEDERDQTMELASFGEEA